MGTTFSSEDINTMFNAFLDTFLKIFYSSFPKKVIQLTAKRKDWITLGIKTSRKHKRELNVASKTNPKLSDHYKKYCEMLSSVINEAKKLTYNNKIRKSLILNKTTWDIVNMETGKTNNKMNNITDKLQFGDELVDDYTKIAEIFNLHLTSIAKVNVVNTNKHLVQIIGIHLHLFTIYFSHLTVCF